MNRRAAGRIVTIPNILSFSRILMVPLFVWAYTARQDSLLTAAILALSALTDLLDGRIARRFNMVSDVGKLLDPIADKLTQGAMLICLVTRFPAIWVPLILMILREAVVGVTSLLAMRTSGRVEGAELHGKVATVFLDVLALSHLLFADMPTAVSHALIVLTTAAMAVSFALYVRKNLAIMRGKGESA